MPNKERRLDDKEIKELIKELKKINPSIDRNIFTSMNNVNLNCILGTKKDGIYRSFLEDYEKFSNNFV